MTGGINMTIDQEGRKFLSEHVSFVTEKGCITS